MSVMTHSGGGVFIRRHLAKILGTTLALLLGAMLLVTIYFTLFDLQWIAFLLGIVFAGVAALASQSAKAHWLVLRREAQLRRARGQLAEQAERLERAIGVSRTAQARFDLVCDAVSAKVVFVDRAERCRYHNAAFQQWCGHGKDGIVGVALRAVVDAPLYEALQAGVAEALKGKAQRCKASWPRPGGRKGSAQVTLLPFPAGADRPIGCYMLLESAAGTEEAAGAARAAPGAPARVPAVQLMGEDAQGRLQRALEENHFVLFAQKIEPVSARAEHNHFQEVLLRMREDEQRLLPPGGFFPVAERYNLMADIDRWVVRNLLEWCAAKRGADGAWQNPLYCVNLSRATLLDAGFERHVFQQIDGTQVPGDRLCFEIAAAHLRDHSIAVRRLMDGLRALGCRFAVDGLEGTRESLRVLGKLKFDFVKIDGFTVLNMLADDAERAKVKAIAMTCRKLRVPTIAQFVETDAIREQAVAMGVDYVQGFGVGKPDVLARV